MQALTLPILGLVTGCVSFSALDLDIALLGSSLLRHQDSIERWFGVLIIVLDLSTIGVLPHPGAATRTPYQPRQRPARCVRRMKRLMSWFRRHERSVAMVGGLILIVVGVSFVTEQWSPLFRPMHRWFAQLGWPTI